MTVQECYKRIGGDYESAVTRFRGVAANLSFTDLQEKASALTEQLRYRSEQPDSGLLGALEKSYKLTVDTISAYKEEKGL